MNLKNECTHEGFPSDLKITLKDNNLILSFRTATVTIPAQHWGKIDAAVKEIIGCQNLTAS